MFRRWRCCVLLLGFSGLLTAGEPLPSRRVAFKFEMQPKDGLISPLLAQAAETVRRGVLSNGVELVPAGEETKALPLLWLTASSQADPRSGSAELMLAGILKSAPAPAGTPAPPAKNALSRVFLRDKKMLSDSFGQTALALVKDLLSNPSVPAANRSDAVWIAPNPAPGATPVEGKNIKLEGVAPLLDYPWEARVRRIEGYVSVSVLVDDDGRVIQAALLDGAPTLTGGMLSYVSNLRFKVPEAFRKRAPLSFTCSFRFGFPAFSKISRVTLEVGDGSMKEPGLQPESATILRAVCELLSKEGVDVVDAPRPDDPDLRHLRIEIETLRSQGNFCVYAARTRLSNQSDRMPGAGSPASSSNTVRDGLVSGQRGEAGFQESLIRSVKDIVRATVYPPHPDRDWDSAPAIGSRDPDPAEFDFSQIKVKRQPPPPPYPAWARQQRVQGTVVLEIEVDEEGHPLRGRVHQGPPELLMTAMSYALGWAFEPAKLNGKPMKARFKLTMPFRLR